jgi:predicted transcriptional regulator
MNDDQDRPNRGHLSPENPANRPLPGLGPLESAIMLTLWDTPKPLKVREVTGRLAYSRDVAYTTVMTVLTILCRKDLAHRQRHGQAWLYAPTLSHDDYLTQRVRDLITLARDPEAVVRNALAGQGQAGCPPVPPTESVQAVAECGDSLHRRGEIGAIQLPAVEGAG